MVHFDAEFLKLHSIRRVELEHFLESDDVNLLIYLFNKFSYLEITSTYKQDEFYNLNSLSRKLFRNA